MDSYNITFNKGSTYSVSLGLTDADGAAINLTNYDVSGFLKYRYSDSGRLLNLNATKTIPHASGYITLIVPATGTAILPVGTSFYDVKIFHTSDGTVDTILGGKVYINPEITY